LYPPNRAEKPTRKVQRDVGWMMTPPLMKIRAILYLSESVPPDAIMGALDSSQ
jgi:hypothetical protein